MRRLVLTTLLALALPAAARAQISPGELTKAHESLEGMKNCLKCHELGAGPSAEKCLECHQEIASTIERRQGYHYRAVGVGKQLCFECHGEHAGRGFDIVHWPDGQDRFDHTQTGWKLGGGHAKLECRKCHKEAFVSTAFRKEHTSVNVSRTFLGLDESCAGCHKDVHAGQFTRACAQCHGDNAWKPAVGFDHATSSFPLRGRHRNVECAKCHVSEERKGASVIRFAGVAHEGCTNCHTDPHAGRLGADCASCHSEDAWKPVTRFDHSRTAFPLTGVHAKVECAKCHKAAAGAEAAKLSYAPLAHESCANCHKDPHAGRLGVDCASCHTTAGWNVKAAGGSDKDFDHNRTRFPLLGLHRKVACEKCHRAESKTADLSFDTCERCHKDPHAGQFAARERGGACEQCHDTNGFVPARYTIDDHARTRFALTGAHLAEPCVACHKTDTFASGETCRRFTFPNVDCVTCHKDPHAGQFATTPAKTCTDCHTLDAWSRLAFDHDKDTKYKLEGQHRTVACARCHTTQAGVARYRSTPTTCEACHSGAQPGKLGGTQ